jgi:hypothetical protein
MTAAGVPAAPGGLRAGQLGVIVIGRVIAGDIAVTLADLAQRELLTVTEAGSDGDWLVSPSTEGASGRQQRQLLGYEKRLLGGLAEVGARSPLSALTSKARNGIERLLGGVGARGCARGLATPPASRPANPQGGGSRLAGALFLA